eukprot:scaffold502200_cov17-Prasinocladus_malaysianus.AAC.1
MMRTSTNAISVRFPSPTYKDEYSYSYYRPVSTRTCTSTRNRRRALHARKPYGWRLRYRSLVFSHQINPVCCGTVRVRNSARTLVLYRTSTRIVKV